MVDVLRNYTAVTPHLMLLGPGQQQLFWEGEEEQEGMAPLLEVAHDSR